MSLPHQSPAKYEMVRQVLITLCLFSVAIGAGQTNGFAQTSYDPRYVEYVHDSMQSGRKFLVSLQQQDGSYPADGFFVQSHSATSLPCLALLKSGISSEDPSVKGTITWLRSVPVSRLNRLSEISLSILVETTLNQRDQRDRLQQLLEKLVSAQLKNGGWPNVIGETNSRLTASQFALLALQDAASIGVVVDPGIWFRIEEYWISNQYPDGGWADFQGNSESESPASVPSQPVPTQPVSQISGTLAGVSSLKTCAIYLQSRGLKSTNESTGNNARASLHGGIHWLETAFKKRNEAGSSHFPVDHLYSLEKMTRRSGDLFTGEEVWRREGAVDLLFRQDRNYGSWPGNNQAISTSYALLYLATGTSPSLLNPVYYRTESRTFDQSRSGVWGVNDQIHQSVRMARILTPHEIDLKTISRTTRLSDPFLQSAGLFLSGDQSLELGFEEVSLLRSYVIQGGTIIASAKNGGDDFRNSIQQLAKELLEDSDVRLTKMSPNHPLYRLVQQVDANALELWELHDGCRTCLVFSPADLDDLWSRIPNSNSDQVQTEHAKAELTAAHQFGLNLLVSLSSRQTLSTRNHFAAETNSTQENSRGAFQIGVIDDASSAGVRPALLQPLLLGIERALGGVISYADRVEWSEKQLSQCPVVYWVGKHNFAFTQRERDALLAYVERGGVILVESSCRSLEFDTAFRHEMQQIFGNGELKLIPEDHEIYSQDLGAEIHQVQVSRIASNSSNLQARPQLSQSQPTLEGIQLRGRYVVIYSPFDLLCSMQSRGNSDCEGYAPADALRIGLNLICYALTQTFSE